MANTDFFDDDLRGQSDPGRRVKIVTSDVQAGPASEVAPAGEIPVRAVSDINLTRMAKHKQEIDENGASAAQERERLRKRQEDLEREKRDLEELRRRQGEFERGRREMIERFSQSLVSLEKEEVQAQRLAELLGAARKRFKTMLAEIEGLKEEAWPEDQFQEELQKALAVIEDARMEFNKSMARIEAAGSAEPPADAAARRPVIFEESHRAHEPEHTFGYWLKVGVAVSLPLALTIVILTVLFFVLHAMAVL